MRGPPLRSCPNPPPTPRPRPSRPTRPSTATPAATAPAGRPAFTLPQGLEAAMPMRCRWWLLLLTALALLLPRPPARRCRSALRLDPVWLSALAQAQRAWGSSTAPRCWWSELPSPISWGLAPPDHSAQRRTRSPPPPRPRRSSRTSWRVSRGSTGPTLACPRRHRAALVQPARPAAGARAPPAARGSRRRCGARREHRCPRLCPACSSASPGTRAGVLPDRRSRRRTGQGQPRAPCRPRARRDAAARPRPGGLVDRRLPARRHAGDGRPARRADRRRRREATTSPSPRRKAMPAWAHAPPAPAVPVAAVAAPAPRRMSLQAIATAAAAAAAAAAATPPAAAAPSIRTRIARPEAATRDNDLDAIIGARAVGVTPEYIEAMRRAAPQLGPISLSDATSMRAVDVTPEFAAAMMATGLRIRSFEDLISARATGVNPASIRSLVASGFRGDLDDCVALAGMGVTPDDVRRLRSVGCAGGGRHARPHPKRPQARPRVQSQSASQPEPASRSGPQSGRLSPLSRSRTAEPSGRPSGAIAPGVRLHQENALNRVLATRLRYPARHHRHRRRSCPRSGHRLHADQLHAPARSQRLPVRAAPDHGPGAAT